MTASELGAAWYDSPMSVLDYSKAVKSFEVAAVAQGLTQRQAQNFVYLAYEDGHAAGYTEIVGKLLGFLSAIENR